MVQVVQAEMTPRVVEGMLTKNVSSVDLEAFQKSVEAQPSWAAECLLDHCSADVPAQVRQNAFRLLTRLENVPKQFCDQMERAIVNGLASANPSVELPLVMQAAINLAQNQDTRVLQVPSRPRIANVLEHRLADLETEADRATAARLLYYSGSRGYQILLQRVNSCADRNAFEAVSTALSEERNRDGVSAPFAAAAKTILMAYLDGSAHPVFSKLIDPEAQKVLQRCCAALGPAVAGELIESIAAKPSRTLPHEQVVQLMLGDGVAALAQFFKKQTESQTHTDDGLVCVLNLAERNLGKLTSLGNINETPRFLESLAAYATKHPGHVIEPAIVAVLGKVAEEYRHLAELHPANGKAEWPFLLSDRDPIIGSIRHCAAAMIARYRIDFMGEEHDNTRAVKHPAWLTKLVGVANETFPEGSEGRAVASSLLSKLEDPKGNAGRKDLLVLILQLDSAQKASAQY